MEEYKIKVKVRPVDGIPIWNCPSFTCELYVIRGRSVVFSKEDNAKVKKIDDNTIKIIVNEEDSLKIGYGIVKMKMTADIPDADFDDGKRTEILDNIWTGVVIR